MDPAPAASTSAIRRPASTVGTSTPGLQKTNRFGPRGASSAASTSTSLPRSSRACSTGLDEVELVQTTCGRLP